MKNKRYGNPYVAGNLSFVWGVKSADDLSEHSANLYTMNDIDIVYDCKSKKFSLSIEEIYEFNSKVDKTKYLTSLVTCFEKFLVSINYGIPEIKNPTVLDNEGESLQDEVLADNIYPNFNCTADNLFDLYIKFKFKVDCWISHHIKGCDKY